MLQRRALDNCSTLPCASFALAAVAAAAGWPAPSLACRAAASHSSRSNSAAPESKPFLLASPGFDYQMLILRKERASQLGCPVE